MKAGAAPPSDEGLNFRELIDIVWSGKLVILCIALGVTLLSTIYALVTPPIYQANGLVQIEQEKNGLTASVSELSSLIGSAPAEASAEIAIIKSRMVLGAVVEALKLYIYIEPNYLPIFGKAIARHNSDGKVPANLPNWLRKYAWGGEELSITALDIPQSYWDSTLVLEALGEDRFSLLSDTGDLLLEGIAGTRKSVETRDGTLSIFVQRLIARPHTQFYVTRRSPPVILDQVARQLSVMEQPRDSGVLALTVADTNPKFAAALLNAVEDAYLRQNVERKSVQAEQSLKFLKGQLPELRANVDAAQAKLNSYQLKKGTVDVQQETQLVLHRAVELETQRLTLAQERDAALQRVTDQHPIVLTLTEQIRNIEREQASIKKQAEALPETQQEILSLMRDLEVNTQLYTALLNSAQELQVTKAGTVGNVRIIDYGIVPQAPIKPRKSIIVAVGLGMGFFLGVAVVFAMRTLLRGVDRPEEVERATGLPTYAAIPFSRSQQGLMKRLVRQPDRTHETVLAALDSSDLAIEALRGLRTSLHFAMLEAENNVVMFTGPVAALGKSFVSINLGAVLAMSGKRVLVMDADLRRGRLHRYVGQEQTPGISDLVAGTVDSSEQIIRTTDIPGLSLIPAGTRPPNPSEILMSERFTNLIRQVSGQFDFVLIDTPPVLPVTDAAIVGRLAGTTLLVLKSAEHPMRAIEETVKRLRQAGVDVRGTIFNQVGARIGSYGYGSYGYSYGYSSYAYKSRS